MPALSQPSCSTSSNLDGISTPDCSSPPSSPLSRSRRALNEIPSPEGGNPLNTSSSSRRPSMRRSPSAKRRSNIPSLVAAFSASLTTGGTTYAFGLYGADLKRSLGLSASELDTISTAFFFAGLFSWIPGLCADKFGTRFSISLGGILGAVALMMYWFVAKKFIQLSHSSLVPALSVLGISIFLSSALVTGSVFKIIVSSCGAGTKGSAVGAAKGYVGLGAGAYACLFESIRLPHESNLDFLPMAAFFAIAAATIPALVLLPTRQQLQRDIIQDDATPRHFHVLYGSLVAMALMVIGNSIVSLMVDGGGDDNPDGDSGTPEMAEDGDTGESISVALEESNILEGKSSSHRHIGMAIVLVGVWLGPIMSLLLLPRRRQGSHQIVSVLDDEHPDYTDSVPDTRVQSMDDDEEARVAHGNTSIGASNGFAERHDSERSNSTRGDVSMHSISNDQHQIAGVGNEQEERGLLHSDSQSSSPEADDNGEVDGIHRTTTSLMHSAPALTVDDEEENLNLVQMLRTPSALLMLWTTTILVGAGTVETNNMGDMVEALGFPEAVTPASLALFSVAQAAARVATGAVSESALNWNTRRFCIDNGVPRPFFLIVASVVGVISHFILGLANHEFFFVVGAAFAGAAFGMVWPLMVLIVGEVFGTANAGANYMFYDGFTSAMGTLLLTKILAQDVYEEHIDPSAADRNTCFGMDCFRMTHMVVALLSLTCVGTSIAMLFTSRHTYNKSSLHRA